MKDLYIYFIFILLIFSKLIFPQIEKEAQTCPQGMISYWKLDEFGAVNTFLDSYGGMNASSSSSNRPTQDTGIVNNARKFNGKSDIVVLDNNAFDWEIHSSFSIELWVKTTDSGIGNKVFIGKYEGPAKMSWWLGYNDSNNVVFELNDSNRIGSDLQGTKKINDGKWHHIVAIRNDSLTVLELYVDGVEDGIITTFFTGNFSNSGSINIGYYIDNYHYSGLLDEIAIYNKALSKDLILHHYNNGLLGKGYCDTFITDVKNNLETPIKYTLEQNYPNPFNPSTTIAFSIPSPGDVKLTVYNMLGQHISTLVDDFLSPGFYVDDFKSGNLPSGVYLYKLEADGFSEIKKMILIR
jgi:hypothetical protein